MEIHKKLKTLIKITAEMAAIKDKLQLAENAKLKAAQAKLNQKV